MTQPTRYPLAWPSHRPRTKVRRRGTFQHAKKAISLQAAARRLETEIDRLGGVYPLLSTNVETRLDGTPRADRISPHDPGACVYFQLKSKPFAMACDTFTEVAQNIAALANHIEATRRIESYGVASASEVLEAFTMLPPPINLPHVRPWRDVFGFPEPFAPSEVVLRAQFRELAKKAHPDLNGGDDGPMTELNVALATALKECA